MISIAIDGPSGSGKSTISRELSRRLSYIYVDTGALYRAIGLFNIRKFGAVKNHLAVKSLSEINIYIKHVNCEQRIFLNDEDVSEAIRQHDISMAASDVSKIPEVRTFLLDLQRNFAKTNNVIMDGRDIGTVILPNATVKIFLTASTEDRANRRFLELSARNSNVKFETVLNDLIVRDEQDTNRDVSPLKPATDAIIIDTTGFSFNESVEHLLDVIIKKVG